MQNTHTHTHTHTLNIHSHFQWSLRIGYFWTSCTETAVNSSLLGYGHTGYHGMQIALTISHLTPSVTIVQAIHSSSWKPIRNLEWGVFANSNWLQGIENSLINIKIHTNAWNLVMKLSLNTHSVALFILCTGMHLHGEVEVVAWGFQQQRCSHSHDCFLYSRYDVLSYVLFVLQPIAEFCHCELLDFVVPFYHGSTCDKYRYM